MHVPAALLVTLTLGADPAPDMPLCAPASPQRAQQAVEGALAYLTQEGTKWVQERQCAACHHTPWLLSAAREARRAGYRFDEAAIAAASEFTYASDNRSKVFVVPGGPGAEMLGMAGLYLTLATDPQAATDGAIRDAVARFATDLVAKQGPDGSFAGPAGRPPLFDSQEPVTLLAFLALLSPALKEFPDQPALAAAREKALAWLEANPHDDDSQQSDALRLVSLVRRERPAEDVLPAIERLRAWQRADGGFPQTHERASDALATGQALFALTEAGVSHEDPSVTRAVSFLVNTQQADGSWAMTSRPVKPGGNGANLLAPITFTGTGWATIGLARAAPR